MTVFQRYMLIQLPGWVLGAVILYGLHEYFGLPAWAAAGTLALLVVKDFVLYPFLRRSYETAVHTGSEALVGQVGVARETLNPQGYVELRGELWLAEASPETAAIPEGSRVRVESADGMRLRVRQWDAREGRTSFDRHGA